MDIVDEKLFSICHNYPEKKNRVIMTLLEEYQNLDISKWGLDKCHSIPGLPGIYSCELTGKNIIELLNKKEIENISEESLMTTL